MATTPFLPTTLPSIVTFGLGLLAMFVAVCGSTVLATAYVQTQAIERASEKLYMYSPFAGMAVGGIIPLVAHPLAIAIGAMPAETSTTGLFVWAAAAAFYTWTKSYDQYPLGREHYETFGDDWVDYYPDAVEVAE